MGVDPGLTRCGLSVIENGLDLGTPPPVAEVSLIMLATTPDGDAYTFKEYERMFAAAGFTRTELHPVAGSIEQVLVSQK